MLKGLMRLEDRIVFSASPAPTADGDAGSDDTSNRVLVVDRAVHDADALINAAGNDANRVEVLTYDSRTDTLDSIEAMLRDYLSTVAPGSIDSIAFAGYGEAGRFGIAVDGTLDLASLGIGSEVGDFFTSHAGLDAFSADFRIDLLGSDIAAGPEGAELIETLEELTGIDFAASTNKTGSDNGADWILETDDVDAKADYFNDDLDSADAIETFGGMIDSRIGWGNGSGTDYVSAPDDMVIYDGKSFFGPGGLEFNADNFFDGLKMNIDFRFKGSDGNWLYFQDYFLNSIKVINVADYGNIGDIGDGAVIVAAQGCSTDGNAKLYFKGVHIGWVTTENGPSTSWLDFSFVKLRGIESNGSELHIGGVKLDDITALFGFRNGLAAAHGDLTLDAAILLTTPDDPQFMYSRKELAGITHNSEPWEHTLFIDRSIPDWNDMFQAALAKGGVKVYFFDSSLGLTDSGGFGSVVDAMLTDLAQIQNGFVLQSIGIASLGTNNTIVIGGETLTTLDSGLVDIFQAIKGSGNIADTLRVDLLASNVFGDGAGDVLAALKNATGLDFAGSINQTGNAKYGGDWIMEVGTSGQGPFDVSSIYFKIANLTSDNPALAYDGVLDGSSSLCFTNKNGTAVVNAPQDFTWEGGYSLFSEAGLKFYLDALADGATWDLSLDLGISNWGDVSLVDYLQGFREVGSTVEPQNGLYASDSDKYVDNGVTHFNLYFDGFKIGTVSGGDTINDCGTISFAQLIKAEGGIFVKSQDTTNTRFNFMQIIAPLFTLTQAAMDRIGADSVGVRLTSNSLVSQSATQSIISNAKLTADDPIVPPGPEPEPPPVIDPSPPTVVEPPSDGDPSPSEPLPGDNTSGDGDDGNADQGGVNDDSGPTGEDILEGEDGSAWDDIFEEAENNGNGDGGDGGSGDGDSGDGANGGETSDPGTEASEETPVLGSDLVSDIYGDAVGMAPGDSYRDVINSAMRQDFGAWFKDFSGDDETSPDEILARLDDMLADMDWAGSVFSRDEAIALGQTFNEMRSSLDIIIQHIDAVFTLLDELDATALPPELVKWIRDGVTQARALVGDAAASIATLNYAMGLVRGGNADLLAEAMVREVQRFMSRISRELRLVDGGLVDFLKLVGEG
ncbi:MAG: DUF4347 domain-containing protein, partial [Planctomycetaceae bacterium]|nr:DUF4347 domain-containing protein [Planctomycetaceae bacterium]